MIWALCAAYALYGAWLARQMAWCDGEMALLPAGRALLAPRYEASFGTPYPGPRLPWRLPGQYWLYGAWISRVALERQRTVGRAVGLALSLPGVALMLAWAQELGGLPAVIATGAILLSSATLVGSYSTASYEGLVASCWLGGLYAWHVEQWPLVALCGLGLAFLRHTSGWQAMALWAFLPWGAWIACTGGYLFWLIRWHPAAFDVSFWRGTPPPGLPRDGWRHGLYVFAQRYEPMAGWLGLACIGHTLPPTAALLAAVTAGTLLVTHGQRAYWRPKWVIGYLPDFALPVVLILGVSVGAALRDPAWWWLAAIVTGWGLARRRHPALP